MADKITSAALAEQLRGALPLRRGPDHEPWRYEHGVWMNCTRDIRKLVAAMAGDQWTKGLPDAVLTHLADTLDPLPPRGGSPLTLNFLNGWTSPATPDTLVAHEEEAEAELAAKGGWVFQVPHHYGDDAHVQWTQGLYLDTPFHEFIRQTWPDDAEAQAFAWEVVGYFLLPNNPLQVAFMLYGIGANGKSVFLDVLTRLLGPDNVSHVSLDLLTSNNFATADLLGKAANLVSEMPAKFLNDTEMFKKLTGSDRIRAEVKYGKPFWFYPTAKHAFSVNEIPGTSDASYGYHRRWVVFPFTHRVPKDRQVPLPELVASLTRPEHIPSILREAVEGLGRLLNRGGFARPASFRPALEQFQRATYEVLGYVDERIIREPGHRTKRAVVYGDYKAWMDDNRRTLNRPKFFAQMRALEFTESRINGTWYIMDCRIGQPDDQAELPPPPPPDATGTTLKLSDLPTA